MSAYIFGARGRNPTKLSHVTCHEAGMIIWVHFMGARTPKISEGKNIENSARFRTTLDFDREYLQRGSRYQKSKQT